MSTEEQEDRMPPAGSWAHDQWLRQRREEYEKAEEQRKADRERGVKQAALEEFLKRRGRIWQDHNAGALPPPEVMETWRAEYMTAKFDGKDPEDERRAAKAERIW